MLDCRPGRFGHRVFTFALVLATLLPPALASADVLRGRVVDPADRAVPNARVLIMRGQTLVADLPTSGTGEFGPVTLAPDTYDVIVAAPGLRLAPRRVTIDAQGTLTLDLRLALAAVGESVVVSAAQTDTPVSRTTDSVTVIDRTALDDLQIDSVASALQQTPGFSVVSSGGRGAVTSLFPRGGESDYTLVLVDGIEQNAFGGAFDAAHLSTTAIDRIEVVRGPQSALYGAGAIGGVVQVITANGGRLRGSGLVEGGSYGSSSSNASIAGSRGPWSFGGGAEWQRTDGVTDTLANGTAVSNDDYRRASGSASLAWSDTATRRIRFDVRGGRNERGFPGPYGSDPAGLYSGIDTISRGENHDTGVAIGGRFASGPFLYHSAHIDWSRAKGQFTSPFGASETENHRTTARYQLDLAHRHAPLSAGVEWLSEQADNTFITGATFEPVPVKRSSTGFFAEARPAFRGNVVATLGVRVERIARRPLETDVFSHPDFDEQVVWSTNPKVALAWFARTGDLENTAVGSTKIRVGAGTGIKAPTAFEIAFTDNPDLQPERSRSFDIGIEQAFANSRLQADATWFHNTFDDLIISVGQSLSGASRYRTDNIANARAQGLELGASWRPAAGLSVRGSWTWLDTEVLDVDSRPGQVPAPYRTGDGLLRRPRSAGSLDVRWASAYAGAFLSLSGRGGMLDLEPNFASTTFVNDGFVTTTIGGSWRVHRMVEVYGRVTNAFDRDYEEVFGFPALGRAAAIGVRVSTGR